MNSRDIQNLSEAYLSIYSEDFKELDPYKTELVSGRQAQLASDILKNRDEIRKLSKKPFAKFRPGIKQRMKDLVKQSKHKYNLVQNASDALIRSSVSREARGRRRIEDLKNKLPMNKIVPFQREELEIILNYLLDEGYASSYESANTILNCMSEEWSYDTLNEANRWEKHRGLTPKERKVERNKNVPFSGDYSKKDPATAARRTRHQQLRGISPKKQRADIERQYQYDKNEWEKVHGKKNSSDHYDDDDDYDYVHDNTPRMPGTKHGRRKPLGVNTIKRMQPYLDSSRTRARRRRELDTQNRIQSANQRKEMDTKSQNRWGTMMSIDDLQDRIRAKRAKNKIVPFQREELEIILNYLLDEGYASSYESASVIMRSMSEEWSYEILNEKVVSGYNPFPQEKVDKQMDRHIDRAATFSRLEKAYRDTPEGQETPWGEGTVKRSPEMARHARDLYQRSINRHVDMAMASKYHDPQKVQWKQKANKIRGVRPDNAKRKREEEQANRNRREKYLKYRRSEVHPPSSSDFIPFKNPSSRKASSSQHKPDMSSHERPSVSRNSSFRKTGGNKPPRHR